MSGYRADMTGYETKLKKSWDFFLFCLLNFFKNVFTCQNLHESIISINSISRLQKKYKLALHEGCDVAQKS